MKPIPFDSDDLILLAKQCQLDENRLRHLPEADQAAIRDALDKYLDSLGSENLDRDTALADQLATMRDNLRMIVAAAIEGES